MAKKQKTVQELEKENKKLKKKKGGAGGFIALLIAIILLALAGLGFGFGNGGFLNSKSGSKDESTTTSTSSSTEDKQESTSTEEVTPADSQPAEEDPTADGIVKIVVNGNTVTVDGKEMAAPNVLKAYLTKINKDGVTYTLIDDKAIKENYDAAKQILDELKLEYKES